MSNTLKKALRVQIYGGKFIKEGNYFKFLEYFGKSCVNKSLAVGVITFVTCLFWYSIMANHPRVALEKNK